MSGFARRESGSPLGKLDAKIKDFRLSSATKEKLEQQAHAQGIDLTQFMRTMCDVKAFGVDTLANLHRERLEAASEKSPECPKR
jgi:hypothetical protein